MTKTLGSAALQLYAGVVSLFLPIPAENQPGLIADLEGDPFVGHALNSDTCELYHRYGMFFATLTAVLTTIKHCHRMAENQSVQLTTTQAPMSTGEPVQSPVERVTEKKEKDPKRLAAGRAGAAVRKAKQKRLHEQLQTAKASLHPPVSAANNDGTSARSSGTGCRFRTGNIQADGQNITITRSHGS